METEAPHTVGLLEIEWNCVPLRHRWKRGEERSVEHGDLWNVGAEDSAAERNPLQRYRYMQRCQLTQCLQSALHCGVDDAWYRKPDSPMDDSMSDSSHISDRILREKGIEHCLEGS